MSIYNIYAASELAEEILREAKRRERRGLDYVVSPEAVTNILEPAADDLYDQRENISIKEKNQGIANYTSAAHMLHMKDFHDEEKRLAGHAKVAKALEEGTLVSLVEESIARFQEKY